MSAAFDSKAARLTSFLRIGHRETARIAEQMAVLLNAGVPSERLFKTLLRHRRGPRVRAALRTLRDMVQSGDRFYDGFAARAALWPPYFLELVRCAELAGRLQAGLEEASEHFKLMAAVRRRAQMVWISPAVIIVFGWVCISAAYAWYRGPAAGLAKWAGYLSAAAPFVLGGLAWRYVPPVKRLLDGVLLVVPAVGGVFRDLALYQFTSCFRYLYLGAISAPDILRHAGRAATNAHIRHRLRRAPERIEGGARFAEALGPLLDWPAGYVEALHVGEESGELDAALAKLAEERRAALEHRVRAIRAVVDRVVAYAVIVTIVVELYALAATLQRLSAPGAAP
jgi:type II secretory pathway component PulF